MISIVMVDFIGFLQDLGLWNQYFYLNSDKSEGKLHIIILITSFVLTIDVSAAKKIQLLALYQLTKLVLQVNQS